MVNFRKIEEGESLLFRKLSHPGQDLSLQVFVAPPGDRDTNNNLYILRHHTIYCKEGEKEHDKKHT